MTWKHLTAEVDEVLPRRVLEQVFHAVHLGVDDADVSPEDAFQL